MKPLDIAAAVPADARRLFGELGLTHTDSWGRASLVRIDERSAGYVLTYMSDGELVGPIRGIAQLEQAWPRRMASFVIDFIGLVLPVPAHWPPPYPALRFGFLVLQARQRLIWDGSSVLAEVRWLPERGDHWSLRGIGAPSGRQGETKSAEAALHWLLGLRDLGDRGRPPEDEIWAREFGEKWRAFELREGRRPKRSEMVTATGYSTDYLKKRYREVIGVPWARYQPPS